MPGEGESPRSHHGSRFTVRIWEGRNLTPKDINGSSDPYCIYGYIDGKGKWIDKNEEVTEPQRTVVVEKTLHPKWLTKDRVFTAPADLKADFRIEVWDRDKLSSDDFMGLIKVTPSDLEDGRLLEGWYPLEGRHEEKDTNLGEIRVSYKYQSETMIIKQKTIDEDKFSTDSENLATKRKKTLARSNIQRWIQCIETSSESTEWLDATIELYEWVVNDVANVQMLEEGEYLEPFMTAVRSRVSLCSSPHRKFAAVVCGILGKCAEVASFHKTLFEQKAHEFCFDQIHFVSPSFYREARQSCLLLLLPYFSFFSQPSGEMLNEKKELAKQVVPVYSDLLRLLNEHEVSCRELVLYITGSLATIAQNLGVESFNDRIMPHIGHLYNKWPGDEQIYTQVAHIFYFINHSPKSEEYLTPISSPVMNGLKNTLQSRFPGTPFEESPHLVRAVIPVLALFTWIGTPQGLMVLQTPKTYFVLAEILRLYSQDVSICHNVVNVFYGCLEHGGQEGVIQVLSKVSYHVIPVLNKNMKIFSRHKSIVTLTAKIFHYLEKDEVCRQELENVGALELITY